MQKLLRALGRALALCTVFAAFLVASCKSFPTVKTYEGERQPQQKVALVSPTPGWEGLAGERQDVYFLKLDGVALTKSDIDNHASLEVLPGVHRLTVAARLRVAGERVLFEDPNPITYNFEAGKHYQVYARLSPGPTPGQAVARFWMEDDSGQVVVGTK
ncbi:hypothetical protein [Piscinibacter defluvii]|uniref:hypothetical protein n=1 Tax=Piscinibacter defluvii TaxID=1796922 RepID=UPI000FDE3336|nr:hypothetical protein [Piscinibacter defluvii]